MTLIYIFLGKSKTKQNYRVSFKSESPISLDIFYIQACVHPTQYFQNLLFLGTGKARQGLEHEKKHGTFGQLRQLLVRAMLFISQGQMFPVI